VRHAMKVYYAIAIALGAYLGWLLSGHVTVVFR
jgi:hypothetical protein